MTTCDLWHKVTISKGFQSFQKALRIPLFILLIDLNPFKNNLSPKTSYLLNCSNVIPIKANLDLLNLGHFQNEWRLHMKIKILYRKNEKIMLITVHFNLLVNIHVNEIPKGISRNTLYLKLLFFQDAGHHFIGFFPNSNQSSQNMFYHLGSKTNRLKKIIFIN